MNKISSKDTIIIGLMLFALFFGAGNLVFPAMLGQASGFHFWEANAGFLVTGVGLPLIGVIAFSFSGKQDLLSLTNRVHPIFGIIYTTLLYLTIGPLFAMPRTGSVSYEIGIKPFISEQANSVVLLLFTIIFFTLTCLLSLNPSKMIDIVGKWLTPLLIIFIGLMSIAAITKPLGVAKAPTENYESNAFFNGFQEGYLTMDTLAAFVFGIIVIQALRDKGASSKKQLLIVGLKSALISAAILAVIYTVLTYIGATSVQNFGHLANGGLVLSNVSHYYFGTFGNIVLGIIVLLACLTTSIGLTTACSTYLQKLIPSLSYKTYAISLSIVSALLANIGLNELIQFSVPVLTIMYPLAIVLIILTFIHPLFKGKKLVYWLSLAFTFIISLVEGLSGTKLIEMLAGTWIDISIVHQFFIDHLWFYDIGLGWFIPAIIGIVIGWIIPGKANLDQEPEISL